MNKTAHYSGRFILLALLLLIVDLFIKSFIINEFDLGEHRPILGEFVALIRVTTVKSGLFSASGDQFLNISKAIFKLLIVLLAIRIQLRAVHKLFKYSTVLISAGWLGNLLDYSFSADGNASYMSTEYLYLDFLRYCLSITSLMILVGWLMLIASVIVYPKDLKKIIQRKH